MLAQFLIPDYIPRKHVERPWMYRFFVQYPGNGGNRIKDNPVFTMIVGIIPKGFRAK